MMTNEKRQPFRSEDRIPENFKIERMSSADFSYTLSSFLYENFRGAIDVVTEGFPFGSVAIAPEGTAYLLRLILKEVYGKYLVGASIILGQSDIKIRITHKHRSLNFDYITEIAEKSGFKVVEDSERTLLLSARVEPEKRLVLYAISSALWRKLLIYYLLDE